MYLSENKEFSEPSPEATGRVIRQQQPGAEATYWIGVAVRNTSPEPLMGATGSLDLSEKKAAKRPPALRGMKVKPMEDTLSERSAEIGDGIATVREEQTAGAPKQVSRTKPWTTPCAMLVKEMNRPSAVICGEKLSAFAPAESTAGEINVVAGVQSSSEAPMQVSRRRINPRCGGAAPETEILSARNTTKRPPTLTAADWARATLKVEEPESEMRMVLGTQPAAAPKQESARNTEPESAKEESLDSALLESNTTYRPSGEMCGRKRDIEAAPSSPASRAMVVGVHAMVAPMQVSWTRTVLLACTSVFASTTSLARNATKRPSALSEG